MQRDGAENDNRTTKDGFKWFRYVEHHMIEEFEKWGWKVVDRLENTPHGYYSVYCQWMGEGEPE